MNHRRQNFMVFVLAQEAIQFLDEVGQLDRTTGHHAAAEPLPSTASGAERVSAIASGPKTLFNLVHHLLRACMRGFDATNQIVVLVIGLNNPQGG